MRHWYFYDSDGVIRGQSVSYSGYDVGGDPNDPDTTCAQCQNDRQHNLVEPGNTGAVAYDCVNPEVVGLPDPDPCDPDCFIQAQTHYINGGVLTAKPTVQMVIDGAAAVDIDPLNAYTVQKTPLLPISFKFVGAGVPDSHQVTLVMDGVGILSPSDLTLTFAGGETNTVNLVAPPQGLKGGCYWTSKYVTGSALIVLGWT